MHHQAGVMQLRVSKLKTSKKKRILSPSKTSHKKLCIETCKVSNHSVEKYT
jgi:hypothetical protein